MFAGPTQNGHLMNMVACKSDIVANVVKFSRKGGPLAINGITLNNDVWKGKTYTLLTYNLQDVF